jgi:Uma2 family endonuclease
MNTAKYEGIPSLVVEVLSPSTKTKDMVKKLDLYMRSGVAEYWIVNLENRSISQYSFSANRDVEDYKNLKEEDTIESSYFSGLRIPLRDIFAEI